MYASFEEARTSLKGQHEEQLVQLENRYWPRKHTHTCLAVPGSNATCFLRQTKEFLPKRVGQSPPDIPGGGRQMLHDDGGAGQNISTRGRMEMR